MRKREKRHRSRPFPYVTLAAALDGALGSSKISRYLKVAELSQEWEDLVGSSVAKHVKPLALHRGILTVRTDSSVWRQEFKFMKTPLLSRISDKYHNYKIRDIRVK